MSAISKIYAATFKTFKDNPRLFQPFLLLFSVQALALIILYFSPRLPLRNIFAPIITTFWGMRFGSTFLHYPYSFLLLPKLAQISSLTLSVFVGALTSGMAIAVIAAIDNNKKTNFLSVARIAISKYMYLFIIVVLWVVTMHYIAKFFNWGTIHLFRLLPILSHPKLILIIGPFLFILNFALIVVIHSLLIYAIPVLILEKEKLWKSILKSISFFKERWLTTLILVGLPMLVYTPFSILLQQPLFLITKFFPEFVAYVILLGIIVNFLFIDPLITVSAALFYLSHRKEK